MYLPSNAPILTDQRNDAARHRAESDARIQNMRQTSACGRARLFNTLVNPATVADAIGMGTAVNTAKLQAQTEISRATGILGTGGTLNAASVAAGPTMAQIIAGAPEVVSLNRGGGCTQPSYQPVPLGPDPKPGMPHRAPNIEAGPAGPMYYRGQDSTIVGDYPSAQPAGGQVAGQIAARSAPAGNPSAGWTFGTKYDAIVGLSGFAPPWADAGTLPAGGAAVPGFGSWLMDNPLLALGLAGAGLLLLSRGRR